MDGTSFLEFLGIGRSPLPRHMIANRVPALGHPCLPQAGLDGLYDLIGQRGDEQVSFDSTLGPVKDRTQPRLAFQRPEDCLQFGQRHKRPPKLFGQLTRETANLRIEKLTVDLVGHENGTAQNGSLTKLEATLLLQFPIYSENCKNNPEFNESVKRVFCK